MNNRNTTKIKPQTKNFFVLNKNRNRHTNFECTIKYTGPTTQNQTTFWLKLPLLGGKTNKRIHEITKPKHMRKKFPKKKKSHSNYTVTL